MLRNSPSFPAPAEQQPKFERTSLFSRKNIASAALAAGVSSLFGVGVYYFVDYALEEERQIQKQESLVADEVAVDGFAGSEVVHVTGQNALVELNLGSCTLHSVDVEISRDDEGQVVDVLNYSFDGYVFGDQYIDRGGATQRDRLVTVGTPITFRFDNQEDLETNILSDEPCKTLAMNNFIQN